MGDLVGAVDAAAHAALAYRRHGLRGSALGCSTRADALAQQCGGASTSALRQASEPLPLTAREREIVMLIADGLSNRAVAERLTLSVRTAESHIYQAMLKTGPPAATNWQPCWPDTGANTVNAPLTAHSQLRRRRHDATAPVWVTGTAVLSLIASIAA